MERRSSYKHPYKLAILAGALAFASAFSAAAQEKDSSPAAQDKADAVAAQEKTDSAAAQDKEKALPADAAMAKQLKALGPPIDNRVPPDPPPPPVQTGRFRVTAMGFIVEHPSLDSIFETDGRGDEVYVRGDSFTFDRTGRYIASFPVQTTLFGELGRYAGGSGRPSPFQAAQNFGGFMIGDNYPTSGPWTEPRRRRDGDLPMVLWEGDLTQGADGVVVIPTIWEWDGASATVEEARWGNSIKLAVQHESARIADVIRQWPPAHRQLTFDNLVSLFITDNGTRPIGSSTRTPANVPAGSLSHPAAMRIDPLILTYDSAAAQAIRPSDYEVRSADGSSVTSAHLPAGVFGVSFIDPPEMQGRYTLFLKLEQLP